MRTTLDIDQPILEELKKLQKREKKSLGRIASSLLAEALNQKILSSPEPETSFDWVATPMGAKVDLRDKDALHLLLDRG